MAFSDQQQHHSIGGFGQIIPDASLHLHALRQHARRMGEQEFDSRQGIEGETGDEQEERTSCSDSGYNNMTQAERKRKKKRSAYVSRYAAKKYVKLLEECVRESERSRDEFAAQVNKLRERVELAKKYMETYRRLRAEEERASVPRNVASSSSAQADRVLRAGQELPRKRAFEQHSSLVADVETTCSLYDDENPGGNSPQQVFHPRESHIAEGQRKQTISTFQTVQPMTKPLQGKVISRQNGVGKAYQHLHYTQRQFPPEANSVLQFGMD